MSEVKDPMNTMDTEIEEAKKAAKNAPSTSFSLKLKKPFTWEDKEYSELEFDFADLTGADFINIEAEVNSEGYSVIAPEFSTLFLLIMAMRCCKQPIGTDAIRKLPFVLFNRIRNRARSFLMNSEI